MKVEILHPSVYDFDGKHLKIGEQEVDDKLGQKLIARKFARLAALEHEAEGKVKLEVATPKKAKSSK